LKIAIIGAGAAGCFAAANIPKRNDREVVVFEKAAKALQKVKISGGGRCNVTHQLFDVKELLQKYPRGKNFLKKTLHSFSPAETLQWFAAKGVSIKAEADGRMFPDTDDSQTIIDCLWTAMRQNGVTVQFQKSLQRIEKVKEQWYLSFADGSQYIADKVLIACGGYPKEEQYHWLRSLGHTIHAPVPSLFTFNLPHHPITALMGLSVSNAQVKIGSTKIVEQGPILITHWGLSGPAILRASAWGAQEIHQLQYQFTARINWLGTTTDHELSTWIQDKRQYEGSRFIHERNDWGLPKRLWEYLMDEAGIADNTKWGELKSSNQHKLIELLLRHNYNVSGKTTHKDEFVTCGGVATNEINPETMESKLAPGLYFAGEILHVDGITGGFNFQHAWSSGFLFAKNFQ